MFERFFRIEKSRTRNEGGSGLGLAIAKHIIESHKQSITVRSTVGMGSTFAFTLDSAKTENESYDVLGMIPPDFHQRLFDQLKQKFEVKNPGTLSDAVLKFIEGEKPESNTLGGKKL